MPMSVQVVAMPWREELCLRAMLEVEVRTLRLLPTLAQYNGLGLVQAGADFQPGWAALEPEALAKLRKGSGGEMTEVTEEERWDELLKESEEIGMPVRSRRRALRS